MAVSEVQQNKMGYKPMLPLVFGMSLPAMFSMLIQALYNIVDSIFVSNYNEDAFTAISLVMPLQMVAISFAVGTAVGVNSLIARRLGARNYQEADTAATTGMFLALFNWLVFIVVGLTLSGPFIAAFHDDLLRNAVPDDRVMRILRHDVLGNGREDPAGDRQHDLSDADPAARRGGQHHHGSALDLRYRLLPGAGYRRRGGGDRVRSDLLHDFHPYRAVRQEARRHRTLQGLPPERTGGQEYLCCGLPGNHHAEHRFGDGVGHQRDHLDGAGQPRGRGRIYPLLRRVLQAPELYLHAGIRIESGRIADNRL